MAQPEPQPPAILQITEEDVEESRPRVRALLVARLESMWEPVRVTLLRDGEEGRPIDPRMLEIGLRICKELGLHYRVYRPPVKQQDDEEDPFEGIDRAAFIEGQLAEIEAKQRSQGT